MEADEMGYSSRRDGISSTARMNLEAIIPNMARITSNYRDKRTYAGHLLIFMQRGADRATLCADPACGLVYSLAHHGR